MKAQGVIRLVGGERERAEYLGTVAEDAGDDLDVVGRRRDREAMHRFAERVEQQVAGAAEVSADDDPARIDVVAGSASARPTTRPASAMTRRQPLSPSVARAMSCSTVSVPCDR